MKIRLAAYLQTDSIVDGEGIRTVIWTQGCPHNCNGCHNPETWNTSGGALVEVSDLLNEIDLIEGQAGITFSGGEPFLQPKECAYVAKCIKDKGLNVWCYSGYTFEELMKMAIKNKDILDFLKCIDVLVDGKFEIDKRSYSKIFAGSSNQRILNVPSSLKKKRAVLVAKYKNHQKATNMREGIYV